ncbi:MAG: NYN domain-containing protein [Candidatus Diapherotrites archaeon]
MTKKRVHLFVDGSNFYHGLKQNNFYKLFSYSTFFQQLNKKYNIEKVYFYDAIKNMDIEPEQYSKQQVFHARLQKDIPGLVLRTRKLKYLFANDRLENAKKNASFCASCQPKLIQFLQDAGLQKLSKEKGIDILLVTDMVKGAFQDRYDIALLASGDADFVPAVDLVQSLKKSVVNLHFYAGSSSELRNACNAHSLIQLDTKGNYSFG